MRAADSHIGVIGLGYVGLPLAVEFGRHYETLGDDINSKRVAALREGHDATREVSTRELAEATGLKITDQLEDLRPCNVYVVTVPTPIDRHQRPDLGPLTSASRAVAKVLSRGDVVIYESTVYPGATEEVCVPLLEQGSGLTAGTYKAPSIRVAEAAKVIENTQRDLTIALINELAMIFNRLGIDTGEVLKLLIRRGIAVARSRVLVMGLAFKEDCPDLRNTPTTPSSWPPAIVNSAGWVLRAFGPWVMPRACSTISGMCCRERRWTHVSSLPPFDPEQ